MKAQFRAPNSSLRSGMVAVVAMILMAILAVLAVAFAAGSQSSSRMASSERSMVFSQAAAESGLEYMKHVLSQISGPLPISNDNLLAIKDKLQVFAQTTPLWNDYAATTQRAITVDTWEMPPLPDGSRHSLIRIPELSGFTSVGGSRFRITVDRKLDRMTGQPMAPQRRITVTSIGQDVHSGLTRQVSADFYALVNFPMFDYGIYSRGTIEFRGNASVMNGGGYFTEARDSQGQIIKDANGNPVMINGAGLRSAQPSGTAIVITANSASSRVDGGCWVMGSSEMLNVKGNKPSYTNSWMPSMPTFEPTEFSSLAPTRYAPNSNNVYTNVRIPAGTNPSLSGTFRGILYIESPNKVNFSGAATLQCAIVFADRRNDGTPSVTGTDTLTFGSQITGDRIPDDLISIREAVAGYGILAPTVPISIQGNTDQQLYGSVICWSLDWTGGSNRTIVDGALISLNNSLNSVAMTVGGNADLIFKKTPNFVKPVNGLYDDSYVATGYRMEPRSYQEGD